VCQSSIQQTRQAQCKQPTVYWRLYRHGSTLGRGEARAPAPRFTCCPPDTKASWEKFQAIQNVANWIDFKIWSSFYPLSETQKYGLRDEGADGAIPQNFGARTAPAPCSSNLQQRGHVPPPDSLVVCQLPKLAGKIFKRFKMLQIRLISNVSLKTEFVFLGFQKTDKMDSVMKGQMGQYPPPPPSEFLG